MKRVTDRDRCPVCKKPHYGRPGRPCRLCRRDAAVYQYQAALRAKSADPLTRRNP